MPIGMDIDNGNDFENYLFDFEKMANVLGTLDGRITRILNDPSQNLSREQTIQLIYAQLMIDTAFQLLESRLPRDAMKAYLNQEFKKRLQERGIQPMEVGGALNQPPLAAVVKDVNDLALNIFPVAAA